MSKPEGPQSSQVPIEVYPVVLNALQRFKNVKNMPLRPFLEQAITFVSIIGTFLYNKGAYYFVSLSFESQQAIQEWTGFKFTNRKTQSAILLVFAFYLIGLKMLRAIMYRYETAPPKKPVPLDWQEAQKMAQKPQQNIHENQPKTLSPDSYTLIIDQLINYSVYGLVFILCTSSYTFFSMYNKENELVEIQQINYLVFWFVAACIFYSSGKIIGKLAKINTFHHFGLAIGIIVIIVEIGLSHGYNMFVFI